MEQRTVKTYYSNPSVDPEADDQYDVEWHIYHAIPNSELHPNITTVADVEGEQPPAGHSWVLAAHKLPLAGYVFDAAVTESIYDTWRSTLPD